MEKDDRSYRSSIHKEDLLLYVISVLLLAFFICYFISAQSKNDSSVYSKLDERMYENLQLNDTNRNSGQEFLKAQLQLVYKRYELQSKVSRTLAYIKFMGFLVGTVLILFGSIVVVRGVRDHPVTAGGEGGTSPLKVSIATSSPGIFLAFIGAVIIIVTMMKGVEADLHDTGIAFPGQASQADQNSNTPRIIKVLQPDRSKKDSL